MYYSLPIEAKTGFSSDPQLSGVAYNLDIGKVTTKNRKFIIPCNFITSVNVGHLLTPDKLILLSREISYLNGKIAVRMPREVARV